MNIPRALFHPRYWPLWLGLGLWRAWVLLPYSWQLAGGRGLGYLMYFLLSERRRISRINISLAFPEKSKKEKARLVKASFKSLGMGIMEAGIAWFMSESRFKKIPFHWIGRESMEHLLKKNRGIIALSGHFTSLEIIGRCFSHYHPINIVYKRSRHPFFEYIVLTARSRYIKGFVKHTQMKGAVQCLKNKEILWYAPDQDFGQAHSVWVNWFGIPTATITGVSVLAEMGHALVMPVYFRRLPEGGYEAESFHVLKDIPSGDETRDAQVWQKALEDYVRRYPDQYLWAHRRFKTRPEGEQFPY